ncbi:hypothetical protein KY334_01040 [Candidatus Woesearchaeota archaeon]|nr:hypothetical protein [Candidatus Woesearchaeota archaeon]
MVSHKLLATYGFLNKEGDKAIGHMTVKDRKEILKKLDSKTISSWVDEEKRILNETKGPQPTGYPKSETSHRIVIQSDSVSLEKNYFWSIQELNVGIGNISKDNFTKITDIFSSSVMSSSFGASSQRLSIQQEKASQYLRLISDMTKSMFQLIGDLNKLKEKMGYYESSFDKEFKRAMDGEQVLKGQYVDLVEGGAKSPSSVFGMAAEVGFSTLPDLFFRTLIRGETEEEVLSKIPDVVDKLNFGNRSFKDVLQRKLSQYYRWKFKSYEQLKTYQKLYKSYLRQHYNNVRLYMDWVKPYLKNIKKLTDNQGINDSVDIVSAFDNSVIEIEYIAHSKGNGAILVNFNYQTIPQTSWDARYQQNKISHMGRLEVNIKSYAWDEKDIQMYKQMKEEEDLELLGEIHEGMGEGMAAIKDTILEYLNEADEEKKKKEEEFDKKYEVKNGKIVLVKKKDKVDHVAQGSILEPFIELAKSFGVLLEPLKGLDILSNKKEEENKKPDGKAIAGTAWLLYKVYKKAHGYLAW